MESVILEDDSQQIHPPAADGIEAIAVRIHERAVQLSNEQEKLRHTEQELRDLKGQLDREKERNQKVRVQYLKSITKVNAIEMECIQMEASIKDRMNKTEAIKEEEKKIAANLNFKNIEWEITEGALTRHKLRQELYVKVLQGVVDQRERAMTRRIARLETTIRLSEELMRQRNINGQNQDQIKMNTKRMTDAEVQENKRIDSLASQVRDALTKRSEHRSSLRETQQKYENIRSEVDRLGHEYRN